MISINIIIESVLQYSFLILNVCYLGTGCVQRKKAKEKPMMMAKTPRSRTRTPSRTPPSHSVGSQSPNRTTTTHEIKEKSKSPKTPKRVVVVVEDLGVERTQQETLKRSKERMRNDQKTMSNINEDLNIPLAGEKTAGAEKDDFDDYLNNLGEHKTKKSREKGSKEINSRK